MEKQISIECPGSIEKKDTSFLGHSGELTRKPQKEYTDFKLNLNDILNLRDTRTTIMIRNIPNKYTQKMLLQKINENHKDKYDFFYLPIDFKVRLFHLSSVE